eukprot:g2860.t1
MITPDPSEVHLSDYPLRAGFNWAHVVADYKNDPLLACVFSVPEDYPLSLIESWFTKLQSRQAPVSLDQPIGYFSIDKKTAPQSWTEVIVDLLYRIGAQENDLLIVTLTREPYGSPSLLEILQEDSSCDSSDLLLPWRSVIKLGIALATALEDLVDREIYHGRISGDQIVRMHCSDVTSTDSNAFEDDEFEWRLIGTVPILETNDPVTGEERPADSFIHNDLLCLGTLLFLLCAKPDCDLIYNSADSVADATVGNALREIASEVERSDDADIVLALRDDCPQPLKDCILQCCATEILARLDAVGVKELLAEAKDGQFASYQNGEENERYASNDTPTQKELVPGLALREMEAWDLVSHSTNVGSTSSLGNKTVGFVEAPTKAKKSNESRSPIGLRSAFIHRVSLTAKSVKRAKSRTSPDQKSFLSETGSSTVVSKFEPSYLRREFSLQNTISFMDALLLLKKAIALFRSEPTVLRITAPVVVVGDTHGQFFDLLHLLDVTGGISDETETRPHLFLGDYVDRGKFSCEVFFYLLALKLKKPNLVYLLRGNHECRALTEFYGFKVECVHKYGLAVYNRCMTCFQALPLACVVNSPVGQLLCLHGGIGPGLSKLKDIENVDRFREPPEEGSLCDILWADPAPPKATILNTPNGEENVSDSEESEDLLWVPNSKRNTSYFFPEKALEQFLEQNNLAMIVRAHQVQMAGVAAHMRRGKERNGLPMCMTVFSAPNYCDRRGNEGGFLEIAGFEPLVRQMLRPHSPSNEALVKGIPDSIHPMCFSAVEHPSPFWFNGDDDDEDSDLQLSLAERQEQCIEDLLPFMPNTFRQFLRASRKVKALTNDEPPSPSEDPTPPEDRIRSPSPEVTSPVAHTLKQLATGGGENEMSPYVLTRRLRSGGTWRKVLKAVLFDVRVHHQGEVKIIETVQTEEDVKMLVALKLLFHAMDRDDDGLISAEDLRGFAEDMGTLPSETDISDILDALDEDGDGAIGTGDFIDFALKLRKMYAMETKKEGPPINAIKKEKETVDINKSSDKNSIKDSLSDAKSGSPSPTKNSKESEEGVGISKLIKSLRVSLAEWEGKCHCAEEQVKHLNMKLKRERIRWAAKLERAKEETERMKEKLNSIHIPSSHPPVTVPRKESVFETLNARIKYLKDLKRKREEAHSQIRQIHGKLYK